MISIYLLCLIVFPIAILYGIKITQDTQVLVSRRDTQFLRGVSACFVVLAHYCINLNESLVSMNAAFYFGVRQLGGIGVLLFFFVSGYGIHESYAHKKPGWYYLWKRIRGVYLPYLIIKFLILIFKTFMARKITFGIQEFLSILLVEDWFIHVILIQYIIFFIIWKFLNIKKVVIYSILFDVILTYMFVLEGKPDGWFNALWLFTFGIACSQYNKEICNFLLKQRMLKIVLYLGAFLITGNLFAVYKGIYWANVFKPIGGIFLCMAICTILRKYTFTSGPMLYFGKRSMYLYIVHINIWPIVQVDNAVIKFWVALVLSVLITEIIYRLTEVLLSNKKITKNI